MQSVRSRLTPKDDRCHKAAQGTDYVDKCKESEPTKILHVRVEPKKLGIDHCTVTVASLVWGSVAAKIAANVWGIEHCIFNPFDKKVVSRKILI